MMDFINKLKSYLFYWLASLFIVPFLFWWISKADTDLLWEFIRPAWTIGHSIIYGDVTTNQVRDTGDRVINNKASVIVRVTRLLLILTISLSVTMILYNGMVYIIETWQGKEWKSLVKNVVLIVVWILVALFSVVIITLIQSSTTTLEEELDKGQPENILREKSTVIKF